VISGNRPQAGQEKGVWRRSVHHDCCDLPLDNFTLPSHVHARWPFTRNRGVLRMELDFEVVIRVYPKMIAPDADEAFPVETGDKTGQFLRNNRNKLCNRALMADLYE